MQKKKPGEQSRKLTNLLALDFASSGVKAVRLKKANDQILLTGIGILDPIDINAGDRPRLTKELSAYYVALCGSMQDVQLRVFPHTWKGDEGFSDVVRENLSVADGYRAAGRVLMEGSAKRPGSVLGVAVPENTVAQYLELFESGAPAPHSLEISGLAAFSAFLFNRGKHAETQTVCAIETGYRYTYAAFFYRNQLQLINRFDVGGDALLRQIQLALGVDAEMAGIILGGGSVDVSAQIRQVLSPFTRQLSIYREFVERQNKSSLSAVYISGGLATSPCWQTAIKEVLGFIPQVWSPFEKIEIPEGVFPEQFKGQEPRFAAAVGAALAGMEVV